MLYPPIDPNERFRQRRAAARRSKRLRRGALIGASLGGVALLGIGAQFVGGTRATGTSDRLGSTRVDRSTRPRALPIEIRGVHMTMELASLPGRLERYLDLRRDGLTALELDVKDERGQIAFAPSRVPLATRVGAAHSFYSPTAVARRTHAAGVYLIGRVVTFEDPMLASARPY